MSNAASRAQRVYDVLYAHPNDALTFDDIANAVELRDMTSSQVFDALAKLLRDSVVGPTDDRRRYHIVNTQHPTYRTESP